ncbi:MAG: glucose-6-phosphate isomerase family protein [Thermoproteota archaeon]
MHDFIKPYSVALDLRTGILKSYKKKVVVKLDDLREFFYDKDAVERTLCRASNPIIYEYYDNFQPDVKGHLNFGVTTINPGKIGSEYYMTRGHYHEEQCASEIYVGLKGEGIVMMQTKEGLSAHSSICRGKVVYIPSFWAHRTINTSKEKLSFLYVYASDAGHDYETIRQKGFAKIVVEKQGLPKIIDNPIFIE